MTEQIQPEVEDGQIETAFDLRRGIMIDAVLASIKESSPEARVAAERFVDEIIEETKGTDDVIRASSNELEVSIGAPINSVYGKVMEQLRDFYERKAREYGSIVSDERPS